MSIFCPRLIFLSATLRCWTTSACSSAVAPARSDDDAFLLEIYMSWRIANRMPIVAHRDDLVPVAARAPFMQAILQTEALLSTFHPHHHFASASFPPGYKPKQSGVGYPLFLLHSLIRSLSNLRWCSSTQVHLEVFHCLRHSVLPLCGPVTSAVTR